PSTDRIVQTKTRIGQNFFRKAVLSAYNYRCCITGLSIPKLLVASHIVPWHIDSANRLNPRNGLALSVLHDKAFDLGMITINEDMTVRVSKKEFRVSN
ncbi:MAG: HNH endonuclease, partial [Gemmatimonadetes bacterium]|nr:HNH endonuclease [Gemmatimonadota bacterium]